MEGARRLARTAEGNLKGESYVGQSGRKTHVHNGLRMLPDITGCTTYGLKGTMSEAELHNLRARLDGGIRNKAARGELYRRLPPGYVRGDHDGELLIDPDEQVRSAIRVVFARFAEFGSVRQVWRWFDREKLDSPIRMSGEQVRWARRPTA